MEDKDKQEILKALDEQFLRDLSDSVIDDMIYGMSVFQYDEKLGRYKRVPPHTEIFDRFMFRELPNKDCIVEDTTVDLSKYIIGADPVE